MTMRHLGSLVARGNTSDVFARGDHAVVKVLRPGIPDGWADIEATTTDLVHAAGLPAPAVLEVTTVAGRPAIVFERIDGPSMWDVMLDHPSESCDLAGVLAALQAEVNATPAPSGIPRLVDRLCDNVERALPLSPDERGAVCDRLRSRSDMDALCHYDVHPNNVLMSPNGPVMIDWFDAAAGDPAADVVRSSILMQREAANEYLTCLDPDVIDGVHDAYLSFVLDMPNIDADRLLDWEEPILVARLAEPVSAPVQRATREAWRLVHASQGSRLATRVASVRARRLDGSAVGGDIGE